jgi:uncharacterized protein YaiI (UPF0178 family)
VADGGEEVTVVFERAPRPALRSTLVEIAHAKRRGPDAADFEIARRVEDDPEPASIQVVTSDRWLAERVSAAGAQVHPAERFRSRIEPEG